MIGFLLVFIFSHYSYAFFGRSHGGLLAAFYVLVVTGYEGKYKFLSGLIIKYSPENNDHTESNTQIDYIFLAILIVLSIICVIYGLSLAEYHYLMIASFTYGLLGFIISFIQKPTYTNLR